MGKTLFRNTHMLLVIRPFSTNGAGVACCKDKFQQITDWRNEIEEAFCEVPATGVENRAGAPSYWFPHPRSGIYTPKGQEWVVEDIPHDAASLDPTFWLRNADEEIDHKWVPQIHNPN